jgi:tryptophan 2,3-dioxygenase
MAKKGERTIDLKGEAIIVGQAMPYGAYLALPELLACQRPKSGEHDEVLFIVIHQAAELWMKLIVHELAATIGDVEAERLGEAFKKLSRVARVQAQLIQSWEVLSTMTPADYLRFRPHLGTASGLQSHQYRTIEFLLGNKEPAILRLYDDNPEIRAGLEKVLKGPSLYDVSLKLLAKRGFAIPKDKTARDWSQPYAADEAVEAAWLQVYGDTEKWFDLYELAEKLVDVEYHFQIWRFSHLKTVERIIGRKRGTGGSSGVDYLKSVLDVKLFPELWSLRTKL